MLLSIPCTPFLDGSVIGKKALCCRQFFFTIGTCAGSKTDEPASGKSPYAKCLMSITARGTIGLVEATVEIRAAIDLGYWCAGTIMAEAGRNQVLLINFDRHLFPGLHCTVQEINK